MARSISKFAQRTFLHQSGAGTATPRLSPLRLSKPFIRPLLISHPLRTRPYHSSPIHQFNHSSTDRKGLSPESEDPKPKEAEDHEGVAGPADITIERYHELADQYIDALVEKLEQLGEEDEQVDCEYSAGVLTLIFPPAGTYIINKQPPNKQIWLSSPISGPKRYDYIVLSESQNSKEGTGSGEWVYLRDGSTLTELLNKEVGVDMSELWIPVPHLGE